MHFSVSRKKLFAHEKYDAFNLGTAGSIYLFRDLVLAGNPESFFLIFCDILCDLPLNDMVRAREKWMKYMIMGVEVSFFGMFFD